MSVLSRTFFLTLEVANGDIWFFEQKETGAERVALATAPRVHFVSFVMHIYGAKFQEHCFNIRRNRKQTTITNIIHRQRMV